jgi:uncharacterized membrane protein YccC
MAFDKSKITRASRLSIAMLISFMYVSYVGVSSGVWVMMTCAIVLFDNPTYGGTLTKSHLRFWGTFFSAAISLLFIVAFANNVIFNLIGIVIGIFFAAYLYMDTKQNYIGGLISWTLPIILINNNDIKSAFLRLLNIAIGIAIAWVMLRFFYPEYARDKMLRTTQKTIHELKIMLLPLTDSSLSALQIQQIFLEREPIILADMARFNRWVEESKPETSKSPEYVSAATKAYWHARRLYRLFSVLIYHFDCSHIANNPKLQRYITQSLNQFDEIGNAIEKNMSSFAMPQNLVINTSILQQQELEYDLHHERLSATTIFELIQEEGNHLVADLIIVFQSRKANNYYSITS